MLEQPQAGAGNETRVEIGGTSGTGDYAVNQGDGYAGGVSLPNFYGLC